MGAGAMLGGLIGGATLGWKRGWTVMVAFLGGAVPCLFLFLAMIPNGDGTVLGRRPRPLG